MSCQSIKRRIVVNLHINILLDLKKVTYNSFQIHSFRVVALCNNGGVFYEVVMVDLAVAHNI
jgi:hypothetical protein